MSFKKNTAVIGFTVGLVSAVDGSSITTGTPIGYYALDGSTQVALSDTAPAHLGNGLWKFNLLAAEMNGDLIGLTFTHASAITAHFTIKTVSKLTSELQDLTATQVNAECSTALVSYDAPTNAEMVARTLPSANYFDPTVDPVANVTLVATTTTNTDMRGTDAAALASSVAALNNIAVTDIVSAGAITTLAGAVVNVNLVDTTSVNTDMRGTDGANTVVPDNVSIASILTDTGAIGVAGAGLTDLGGMSTAMAAGVRTEATTALTVYDAPTNAEMLTSFTEIKGPTWVASTDTLEALRDRGDVAWVTGAGGSSPSAAAIRTEIDANSTQLAAIVTNTNEIGVAGAGLTNIALPDQTLNITGNLSGSVGSVTAPVGLSAAAVNAIWDELQAGHVTAGSFGLFLDTLVSSVSASGGLTAQDVRDAMKLAPTAGASAAGSVDLALDNIEVDTNELQTAGLATASSIAALNDVAATDIVTGGAIATTSGAVDVVTTNTDMRGTDSGALATALALVNTAVNGIQTDLSNGVDGLGAIKTAVDGLPSTDTSSDITAILADTNELQTDWINGGRLDLILDSVLTNMAALNDVSVADINTQVSDVIKTDTIAEQAIGVPPATPTLEQALMYIYMALRNKIDVTAAVKAFHNDAGATVWSKGLSDDGTTYSEAKGISG